MASDGSQLGPVVGGHCANCFRGILREGTPTGTLSTLDGAPCYYAAPPASAGTACPTILFLTDVFGHIYRNNQLLADQYALKGFHVLMPDLFEGRPVDGKSLNHILDVEPSKSFCGKVSNCFSFLGMIPTFISFIKKNGKAKIMPRCEGLARAARAKATELGSAGSKLGVVGFCFGGTYAILLPGLEGTVIDSFVAVHPGAVKVPDDIEALKSPGLFALSGIDHHYTIKVVDKIKAITDRRGNEGGPKVEYIWYPGVSHGFAVRGPPSADEMRGKCIEDVTNFFNTTLR